MIKILSKLIAVVITIVLACSLYPICAICWFFGLIGKMSTAILHFTNSTIKKLWSDIKDETEITPNKNKPEQTLSSNEDNNQGFDASQYK